MTRREEFAKLIDSVPFTIEQIADVLGEGYSADTIYAKKAGRSPVTPSDIDWLRKNLDEMVDNLKKQLAG